MSLEDIPKKVQYVVIDSNFINGTNNTFSVDFTLKSNTHVEDMNRVIGFKLVDFYVTGVGDDSTVNPSAKIAKYVDIVCPEIPKAAQMLDERNGQVLTRVPVERHFENSGTVLKDKQWVAFNRKTNYFNPISIKQLNFKLYALDDDGGYQTLQPGVGWFMVIELTTIDTKEPPRDKEVQILQVLEKLLKKIDRLNSNVQKIPEKPPEEQKKYSFGLLVAILASILGGFIWWVNRSP